MKYYKKSFINFLWGILNLISFQVLPLSSRHEIIGALIFVSIIDSFALSIFYLGCSDLFSEIVLAAFNALLFSTLCSIFFLTFFNLTEFILVCMISFFCIFGIVGLFYKPKTKSLNSQNSLNSMAISNNSIGGADFVYDDNFNDENEVDVLMIENILEGFRVRMDKLPEKKNLILSSLNSHEVDRRLAWNDFQNITHLIDSSSCHIYVATWNNKKVVLKLIKADRVHSNVALCEFETEVSVLSRLNHGNVVRYLGSGYDPRRFIVLEHLEGGTLATALGMRSDNNPKNPKIHPQNYFTYLQSLHLARSLAISMDYLHSQWHDSISIVHRDLKPDNIGFTSNGILKVFDFGLCACITSNLNDKLANYKMTGNTGTLRYMAPEVALGKPYNQSVDVYSFGIIFWQILKGQLPFEEMDKKMFYDKVVRGRYRPELDFFWPRNLQYLLAKCWHDDFTIRPSFKEVVVVIDELIETNKKYFSCCFMSLNIPVNFTDGCCCIDPEFIVKYRHFFIFSIFSLFLMSIILFYYNKIVLGTIFSEVCWFSVFMLVYISWDYWPSSIKGNAKRWSLFSLFRTYEALDRDQNMNISGSNLDVYSTPLNPIHKRNNKDTPSKAFNQYRQPPPTEYLAGVDVEV